MAFTYLSMFVSVEELDSPVCQDDFQDVEIKDEPFDYVSTTLIWFLFPYIFLSHLNLEDEDKTITSSQYYFHYKNNFTNHGITYQSDYNYIVLITIVW